MKNSAYLQELAAHVLTTDAGKVTLVFDDSLALRRMSVDQARELAQCLLDAACDVERSTNKQAAQSVLLRMSVDDGRELAQCVLDAALRLGAFNQQAGSSVGTADDGVM